MPAYRRSIVAGPLSTQTGQIHRAHGSALFWPRRPLLQRLPHASSNVSEDAALQLRCSNSKAPLDQPVRASPRLCRQQFIPGKDLRGPTCWGCGIFTLRPAGYSTDGSQRRQSARNEIGVDEIQDLNIFRQVFPRERRFPRAVRSRDYNAARLALPACYSAPDHLWRASAVTTALLSFARSILSSPKLQSRESAAGAKYSGS
jgi:hypothetical protein